jgi:hypothetical protein
LYFVLPIKHLEALIRQTVNVVQVLDSGFLFPLRLTRVRVQQMAEVADSVVPVLVQRAQEFFHALLNTVRVGRVFVQSVRVARHGVALLFVDGSQNSLLVDGRQLAFFSNIFVFHRLDQFLESDGKETRNAAIRIDQNQ